MPNRRVFMSRFYLWVILVIVLLFHTSDSVYAFKIKATDVPWYPDFLTTPIHEEITRDGLYFLQKPVQDTIAEANRRVDQDYLDTTSRTSIFGNCPGTECKSFDWEHFDNCQFSESVNHINDLYNNALNAESPDLTTIAHNFGRLLHTAQDFYAHSNWVELGKTQIFDNGNGLWQSITPFTFIDDVMIIEGDEEDIPEVFPFSLRRDGKRIIVSTSDEDFFGLISGAAYTTKGCPNSIAIGHWDNSLVGVGENPTGLFPIGRDPFDNSGLNKDDPGRDGYYAARRLAVSQTTHEWCRLVNLIRDTYGNNGVATLLSEWVIPDQLDNALSDCIDLNLSIDVISSIKELMALEVGESIIVGDKNNLLDLMFVIDTTGSMEDDIAAVKQRALEIINQVGSTGSNWQIGIVTYRDHPQSPYGEAGDYVSKLELPFSANQNTIITAINGITVAGGGDGPEAVFAGLLEAIKQPWRTGARKVIILMGDAPPHDPDPLLDYTSQTVLQAAYDVDPASIFPILIQSENAVRFPFQVLADGSSGRLFYAADAVEVVPAILSTISVATGVQLSIGLDVQIASLEPAFPMRSSPSMNASVIRSVPRSEQASIIDGPEVVFEMSNRNVPQNFIWWKIRTSSGDEGWTQERYYGEPILVPVGTSSITPVECTLSTIGDVNIRSGPGTEYEQIASRAGAGQILAANGQSGNIGTPSAHWWQLIEGFWVRNDQVREAGNCPGLPVASVP